MSLGLDIKTMIAAALLGLAGCAGLSNAERAECANDDASDWCVGADRDGLGDWQEVRGEVRP